MPETAVREDDGEPEVPDAPEPLAGHGWKWMARLSCGHVRVGRGWVVPGRQWRVGCTEGCRGYSVVEDSVSTRPEVDANGKS